MMTVGSRLNIPKETAEVINRISTDNVMTKKRRQAMINKSLNRKLKIEHY